LAEERREVEAGLERQRDLQARREQADREFEDRRTRLETGERERDAVVRELDEARARLDTLAVEIEERSAELDDVGLFRGSAFPRLEDESLAAALERVGVELLDHLDVSVREFRARQAE